MELKEQETGVQQPGLQTLKVFKEEVFEYINRDLRIDVLADDCGFTEGPVWNRNENHFLFSDISANCIYTVSENEYRQLYMSNSGTNNVLDFDLKPGQEGSNGLAYDTKGRLVVCRHGEHDLVFYEDHEAVESIKTFRGKLFNSPNDVVVHPDGSVFFTDPPYGLKNAELFPSKFQPFAGVYCYRNGEVKLVSREYRYPNGVCLSPDQTVLYVSSTKPFEKRVSMFDTQTLAFRGVLAEENCDGIKTDRSGNLYLCTRDGVLILDADGRRLALINPGAAPTNCCWGGKDGGDMLVTAREYVFLIKGLLL